RYVRPGRVHSQLGAPVITSGTLDPDVPREKKSVAVLNQIGAKLPKGRKSAVTLKDLGMAGYRSAHALQVFQGARLVCVVVSFLFAFVMHLGDTNPAMRMLLLIGSAGIGWRLPGFLLKKKVAGRQERLKLSLPDALDLTIVSIEAGLG